MISQSTDYMPIATWEWGEKTYLVHVATLQERPVSLLIAADDPAGNCSDAMVPTTQDLGELIGFWNGQSIEARTDAAERALNQ